MEKRNNANWLNSKFARIKKISPYFLIPVIFLTIFFILFVSAFSGINPADGVKTIEITGAEHLDENRVFIENVYDKVNSKDGVLQNINSGNYLRVTFEKNLTSSRDITIYARKGTSLDASTLPSSIEVYEKNENKILATFSNVAEDREYKIYLINLNGNQNVFDLKVLGNVEFDYVVDPIYDSNLTVTYRGESCLAGETDILHISDYDGGHAELPSASNFSIRLCVKDSSGLNTLTNSSGYTWLSLFEGSDSHAEKPGAGTAILNVSIGSSTDSINCSYTATSGSCSANQVCIATISDSINAHIGNCSSFSSTICCGFNNVINLISPANGTYLTSAKATGGNITYDGLYTIHTFYSNGTFNVTGGSLNAEVLVVAGGGGGGSYGGGGAGGLIYNSLFSISGINNVMVGVGGLGHANSNPYNGGNSSFGSINAVGGGAGGGYWGGGGVNGVNGGSGGGGGNVQGGGALGGAGINGQGYAGGTQGSGTDWPGAGGGGASEVGHNGTQTFGGAGGNGTYFSQFTYAGSPAGWFAGGGGGGEYYNTPGVGGAGGGGHGGQGINMTLLTAGINGTGGGGGGAGNGWETGASGGSGIVIVRYLTETSTQSINFTANLTDNLGIQNATIHIYNSTGLYNLTTMNYSAGVTQTTLGIVITLVDNVYTWFVNLFDWGGNQYTAVNNTVTIDTTFPLIDYGAGTLANGVNVSQSNVYVNVSVTETNEANVTFRLFNSTSQITNPVLGATGGNITYSGGYTIHTFYSNGTFNVTGGSLNAEVLVVAGGGGGGNGYYIGGGGGAGGLIYNSSYIVSGSNSVIVGTGGAGGIAQTTPAYSGGNSTFASLTAIGGGRSSSYGFGDDYQNGANGGSGGGSFYLPSTPGNGTVGQGNAGGQGVNGGNVGSGGGGGAGGVGGDGTTSNGGDGGVGLEYPQFATIGGSPTGWFAGGGGGAIYNTGAEYAGAGGLGGGGAGSNGDATNGTANTGGGGGGAERGGTATGGSGGSGIVIVRYLTPTVSAAGTRAINWTGLSDGDYAYNVTVTDLAGNSNTTATRTITLDTHAPNATLISPTNGTYANSSSQNFTANLSDNLGIQNATIYIYNSTGLYNATTTNYAADVTTTTLGIVVTLVDNVYTWFVNLFDWAGNPFTTANNTLAIDTAYPQINFTNPTPSNGTAQNVKSIFVNMTTSDTNSISSFVNFDNSLVSWWRLEQGNGTFFADELGRNNGTRTAFAPTFTSLGKFGGAYSFDAVNNFIDVGTAASLNFANSSAYTFSSWIKISGVGSDGVGNAILGKRNSSGAGYTFYVYNDSRGLYFQSDSTNITSNSQLNFNTWYHVAYTRNSSNQYLFVNGNEVVSGISPTLSTSAATFYIGASAIIPPTNLFNGKIDEVLAFNRSLSLGEIKSLYNANANQYQNNFTNLGDGTHTFKGYVIDAGGFKNSTGTRNVTVDTINPTINFTSPTDTSGSYFSRTNVVINVTASDVNFVNITIKVYNSTSLVNSLTSPNFDNFVNLSGLTTNGIYFFNATATDRAGNVNHTETRNITLDTTRPLVDYGTGTAPDKSNLSQSNIYVNVSVTETNEANVTFRLFNSTSQITNPVLGATGGNITYDGLYTIHTFLSNGTFNVTGGSLNAEVLVVAGGGGGGGGRHSTGGGAGGLIYTTGLTVSGINNIIVGDGGSGGDVNAYGSNGLNSTAFSNTSIGGGGGAGPIAPWVGRNGGSGGGSCLYTSVGGVGVVGQGYDGGRGTADTGPNYGQGGGGGAGAVGAVGTGTTGGDGGDGLNYTINGFNIYYAGGGGAGTYSGGTAGIGGNGGGGNGGTGSEVETINGGAGTDGLGGGGGGGNGGDTITAGIGGNGGSGIVIVRYLTPTSTRAINWTGLADGDYTYNVTVTDLAGNSNTTATITITLDTHAPNATLISPANGTYTNNTSQNFTANLSDNLGIQNATLFVYNSTGLFNSTIINYAADVTTTTLGIIVTLVDNVYTWFYQLFDWAGNQLTTANNTVTIDTINPGINVIYPQNITYNVIITAINYTLSDLYPNTCWFYNGTANNTIACGTNITTKLYSNQGNNTWIVYANDSAGNINSSSLTFFVDTINPTINFTSPTEQNGAYLSKNSILVNVTANDTNLVNITIDISNSTTLINSTTTLSSPNYQNISVPRDGIYYINATTYDSALNKNSTETRIVTLDTTKPLVNYGTGTLASGVNVSQSNVYADIIVTEINEANVTFRLFNSTSQVNVTTLAAGTRNINWTSLSDKTYSYNITITDLAGNSNTTATRTITLDTHAPNATLISPTNGTYLNVSNQNFTANLSDNLGIQNSTLYIYNSSGLYNATVTTYAANVTTTTLGIVVNLLDNVYTWFVNLFDWAGNQLTTANNTAIIDTTNPLVDYGTGTLASGVNVSQSNVYADIIVTEINEANVTFRLFNSTSQVNVTTLAAGTRNINWTSLSDKTYSYNITITDLAGNSNTTATRTITLDTHAPNATLISPTNGTYLNVSNQNFTANLSDNLGIQNSTLYIYNSSGLYNATVTTYAANVTTTTLGIVVNLLDNVYTWFVNLFDWAGNTYTTQNNTVTIDTLATSAFNLKPITNTSVNISDIIEISVNLTDATPISSVRANITKSDSTSEIINLVNAGGDKYNNSFIAPNLIGRFNVSIIVNDSAGNINNTEATYFIVNDNILPTIEFVYPTPENSSIKGSNITSFKIDITDNIAVDSCILNLDEINYTMTKISSSCNLTISNIANGWHNFTAFVNDSSGNINQTETRTYYIDIRSPDVQYVTPTETSGTYLSKSNILINVSVNLGEVPLSNITLWLYNSSKAIINQTITITSPNFVNIIGLADGIYHFNATAINDLSLRGYTETRTVTLDTLNPSINFTSLTETSNSYLARNYILVNVTANDTNFKNITISLFNSTQILINSSKTLTSPNYINFSGLNDGIYYINATAYDSALNKNSTETRIVTLDTTKPLVDYGTGTAPDKSNLSQSNIYVNVSVTETNEANVTFRLFNSTSQVNITTLAAGTRSINWTSLPDKTYSYNVTVTDLAGNSNTTATRTIALDVHAPNATLISPTNGTYLNVSNQNFTANLSDNLGIQNSTLYIYNSTGLYNATTTNYAADVTTTTLGIVVNLLDNVYTWFVNLFDWAGNQYTTANNTAIIDITRPLVDYGTGTLASGINVSQSNVYVNIIVTETNEANVTFRLFNSTSQVNVTTLTAGTRTINWTGLADGVYTYNVTVIDLALNTNTTLTRIITLDVHAPNATLISPTNGTYLNVSNQNFTANLSDNLGIQNSTLYIYNSTGLYNATTTNYAADVTTITLGIVVNLFDNVYTWFVNLFDWAGNSFTFSNNTVTIDTINPGINVIYPQNITYNVIITAINYTLSDLYPNTCWFYNGTANNTIACGTNITTKLYSNQGNNTWMVYANDSAGNINSSSLTFFVDTINPTINFTSPTEQGGSYLSKNSILVNVTSTDTNLANITISISNSTTLINSTTTLSSPNYQNISVPRDGIYYINATAYDSAGNKNSTETRIVTLDTTKPLVNYGTGTLASGVNVSQSNVYVNVSVTETNEANVTFRLFNSTSQVNVTTLAAGTRSINWTSLPDKTYSYNVTVTDLAGNSNTTLTRTITLDVHAPNATLISPTNGTYLNVSNQNFTANLSDNLGIQNSTLYIYNSTGLYNATTTNYAADVTTTTLGIVVNLLDNVYTWFVNLFDWAGNNVQTGNRTIIVDTAYPIVSFGTGTESNGISSAKNNIYINVSVIETNEANITFNLYNSTSLINRTTFTTPVRTINFTNLSSSGVYSYNVTVTDLVGNENSTETRTITLAFIPPRITNVIYSPNSTDDIDPGTDITFNATISTDDFISISTVILEYYNGTGWTNRTMVNAGGNVYQANITLIGSETNYTYSIFANDSVGNTRQTTDSTLESAWDCSWYVSPTTLGATSGFSEKKNLGTITINNTGDAQFATNNCTLDFRLTYDLDEYRIYFDNSNIKPSNTYTVLAKESSSININATFLTEIKSELVTITANELYSRSNRNSMNVSASIVTVRGDQAYLFTSIVSAPTFVLLKAQDFTLSAYIRNLAGDGSLAKSAYDVDFNWTMPSGFIVKEGDVSVNYPIMLDNSADYNDINIVFNSTNLPLMSPGAYMLYVYGKGKNSSGGDIIMLNNNSLVTESREIILVCSNASDGICVSSCGYLLDSDCSAPSPSVISGSGGGGGGGGSATVKIEKSEATFELVRGKEQSFQFPIKNKYPTEMKNITISVTGLNAEYISIEPKTIDSLLGGASKNISVTIRAPAYFTGRTYNLTFEINSLLILNNTSSRILEKKLVILHILEIPRLETDTLLNSSLEMINKMNSSGMFMKNVNLLLDQLKNQYRGVDFFGVKSSYQKIKLIYDNAFESKSIIEELNLKIAEAENNGISATETKKMLYIGETAYARGDYALALERLKEAKLTYAAEVKGEFNLAYYIKNNPSNVLGIILAFVILSLITIFAVRFVIYKKKLKMLKEEEILLLELMKVIQRECFEKGRMSMGEYEAAMNQYERKLSMVIEDGIRIETKLSNMFKIRAKRDALSEEKKKLILLVKKLQDEYLNKNKIETRVYENMLKSYTTKLSEVQEKIAFIDAGDALKKQKFLRRMFRI